MVKKDIQGNLFGDVQEELIGSTKAMTLLGLSRHTFEKLVAKGFIKKREQKGKAAYSKEDLTAFMQTEEYRVAKEGVVDPRNTLNDLTGKDWIPETKSYFFQKGLGADHPDAQIEKLHPAPYSFQDIEKLILFFTKQGMIVLDPFGGVGSTAKACEITGRTCISIELQEKYHQLSLRRLEEEVGKGTSSHHTFINGDSTIELPKIETNSVDFMVTSPPYWGILHKLDQKVKKNRVANNLDTKYSDDDADLGNVDDYNKFLDILVNKILLECARVLRVGRYMAIVVSDFRDKEKYVSFHSDIIQKLDGAKVAGGGKMLLQGTKILIQNHKSLLPYGYPFSYVENIHHQYVLIFRKSAK
jgi:DNA modification methylase